MNNAADKQGRGKTGGVTAVAALFSAFLVWMQFGWGGTFVTVMLMTLILFRIAVTDWLTMKIPNRLVLLLLLPTALSMLTGPSVALGSRLAGFFAVSVPMILMNAVIKGSFGGGDVKLMAAGGLLLGFEGVLTAMFLAVMTGGSYAVWMMASGRMKRGGRMAFGPFLAIGIWISCLYGKELLAWYIGLF